jgi:acyl-CoA thioester hydrolase
MAALLGLPEAFTEHANSTLLVREQHIRFLKEAHAGAVLHMVGGVVEMGEDSARLIQLLIHSESGELAATFQTVVSHVTPREARPFPWPQRARERAEGLQMAVPDKAQARSISLEPFETAASLGKADDLGLPRIGLGAISPTECDVFGRMRTELFIGRVSDGIGALVKGLRDVVSSHAPSKPARVGGAVLEYRLVQLNWPRAGERFELRSGLMGADSRTMKLVHWMINPDTGEVWGTSEAVAITFDLDARKVVPIEPAAHVLLMQQAKVGLAP